MSVIFPFYRYRRGNLYVSPHPSRLRRATFPRGGRFCVPSSLQTPICRHAPHQRLPCGKGGIAFLHPNISKSSPKGIPHLISDISYLKSSFPAPSAAGDRGGGATRCESKISMIAGGNHTLISPLRGGGGNLYVFPSSVTASPCHLPPRAMSST